MDRWARSDGTDADFSYASNFLGQPLLGMRVRDARCVVRFLRSRPDVEGDHISIVGRGWAGPVALFTAALEERVSSVAVERTLVSFGEVARAEIYEQPVSLLLPNVLRALDLTDVYAALAPRPLLVINPLDPLTRPMCQQQADDALGTVRDAYRKVRAEKQFDLRVTTPGRETEEILTEWALHP